MKLEVRHSVYLLSEANNRKCIEITTPPPGLMYQGPEESFHLPTLLGMCRLHPRVW